MKDRLFNKLNSIKVKPELSQWLNVSPRKMRNTSLKQTISLAIPLPQLPCPKKDLFLSLFSHYKTISSAITVAYTAHTAWPTALLGREALVSFELRHFTPISTPVDWQTQASTGIQEPMTSEACNESTDVLVH